jgi:hypothetical protein
MPSIVLARVRMSANMHTNETDNTIHSLACVTGRFHVTVCRPAVSDDCSAGFDPVTKNSHQRVDGSLRNALNTTDHTIPFLFVSPMVLEPTEIAIVDFDGLVLTADFLKAAQHVVQMTSLESSAQSVMIADLN